MMDSSDSGLVEWSDGVAVEAWEFDSATDTQTDSGYEGNSVRQPLPPQAPIPENGPRQYGEGGNDEGRNGEGGNGEGGNNEGGNGEGGNDGGDGEGGNGEGGNNEGGNGEGGNDEGGDGEGGNGEDGDNEEGNGEGGNGEDRNGEGGDGEGGNDEGGNGGIGDGEGNHHGAENHRSNEEADTDVKHDSSDHLQGYSDVASTTTGTSEAISRGTQQVPPHKKRSTQRIIDTDTSGYPTTNHDSSNYDSISLFSEQEEADNITTIKVYRQLETHQVTDEVDPHGNNVLHKLVLHHSYDAIHHVLKKMTTTEKHRLLGARNSIGETPLDVAQTRRMAYLLVSGKDDQNLSTDLIEESKIFMSIDYEQWKDADGNSIIHLASAIGHIKMIEGALISELRCPFTISNKAGRLPYDLSKNHRTRNLLAWVETLDPDSYPLIVPPRFIIIACDMNVIGLEDRISSLTMAAKSIGAEAVVRRNPTKTEIYRLLRGDGPRDLSTLVVIVIAHYISRNTILVQNQPVAIQHLIYQIGSKERHGIPKALIIHRCEESTCTGAAHQEYSDTDVSMPLPVHDMVIVELPMCEHQFGFSFSEALVESDSRDSFLMIFDKIVRKAQESQSIFTNRLHYRHICGRKLTLKEHAFQEDFDYTKFSSKLQKFKASIVDFLSSLRLTM